MEECKFLERIQVAEKSIGVYVCNVSSEKVRTSLENYSSDFCRIHSKRKSFFLRKGHMSNGLFSMIRCMKVSLAFHVRHKICTDWNIITAPRGFMAPIWESSILKICELDKSLSFCQILSDTYSKNVLNLSSISFEKKTSTYLFSWKKGSKEFAEWNSRRHARADIWFTRVLPVAAKTSLLPADTADSFLNQQSRARGAVDKFYKRHPAARTNASSSEQSVAYSEIFYACTSSLSLSLFATHQS